MSTNGPESSLVKKTLTITQVWQYMRITGDPTGSSTLLTPVQQQQFQLPTPDALYQCFTEAFELAPGAHVDIDLVAFLNQVYDQIHAVEVCSLFINPAAAGGKLSVGGVPGYGNPWFLSGTNPAIVSTGGICIAETVPANVGGTDSVAHIRVTNVGAAPNTFNVVAFVEA